ncbi:MAG: DUF6089 family protein [Bacteroidales bacterium]|jgi:hypothetical protein|nr:DUF6089 family protein [Bacteroidales bacterium]
MRRILIILTSLMLGFNAFCQNKMDLGLYLGASYYQGDLNQKKILNSPNAFFGFFSRYNIDEISAVKADLNFFTLSSDYTSSSSFIPGTRDYSFKKSFVHFSLRYEVNFFRFSDIKANSGKFTPYIAGGFGCSYDLEKLVPSIPFGGGVKFKIKRRYTVGLEWIYSKSFSDEIDDVSNGYDNINKTNNNASTFFNNDWYSFIGVHISYKLRGSRKLCRTYTNGI